MSTAIVITALTPFLWGLTPMLGIVAGPCPCIDKHCVATGRHGGTDRDADELHVR